MKLYSSQGNRDRMPSGIVGDDGSFSISYYGVGDGAPAGEYRVLLAWMQAPAQGGLAIDRLRGRYLDPSTAIAAITVKAGENHIPPISLPAPRKSDGRKGT
ncbi:MAG: hypothetical protein U0836_15345 [Pirellulales bacterium]